MNLVVENLTIAFPTNKGYQSAVHDLSFQLKEGEILGVVGESGCGKSVTNYAIMGLLPTNARISAQRFTFNEYDLLTLTPKAWQQIRGIKIAMIFQDPMSALNPSYTVETQLVEALRNREPQLSRKEGKKQALMLLEQVGINLPDLRLKSYPHELSGGMAQRVMIAMALACKPQLLIADEPTTALDVTIQAQILALLKSLCQKFNMAMILVSHDISVVKAMTSNIQIMYCGEVIEVGETHDIVSNPRHPYTRGLIQSLPCSKNKRPKSRLQTIPGIVPPLGQEIIGCKFLERCSDATDDCKIKPELLPRLSSKNQKLNRLRCHLGAI
jgi:oligopeptide/dipeptide ABC transporter ATP-binding protein